MKKTILTFGLISGAISSLVMVAIVLISVMPMGIEWLNARRRARLAVVAPSIAGAEPVAIAAEKTSALESPHS